MPPDAVAAAYWGRQNAFVSRESEGYFSPTQYERTFAEYLSKKRGLLGSSEAAIDNATLLVAADHVELGLQHAEWAKRSAEAALNVGDLGEYRNWPREFGLYTAYKSRHQAKWLLGEAEADEDLQKSLQYLARCRTHYDQPNNRETAGNKELDSWGYVVPFLIGGQIQEARRQFDLIYPGLSAQANKLAKNSSSFPKVLRVLLDHLNGNTVSEELARKTVEGYYANITGWGHEGTGPRATMWKELVRPQHVDFARIRAQYATHVKDAIAICRSIRGIE